MAERLTGSPAPKGSISGNTDSLCHLGRLVLAFIFGRLTQRLEWLFYMQFVIGSNPIVPTNTKGCSHVVVKFRRGFITYGTLQKKEAQAACCY